MKIACVLFVFLLVLSGKAQISGPYVPLPESINQQVKLFQINPILHADAIANIVDTINIADLATLIGIAFNGYNAIPKSEESRRGTFGNLNRKTNKKRNKIYRKKVLKESKSENTVFLIEGDSWFNFPVLGKADITKVMEKDAKRNNRKYWIYSNSFGGDWFSKKISEQVYMNNIKSLHPDVVIFGGGGNDMVMENLPPFIDNKSENNFVMAAQQKRVATMDSLLLDTTIYSTEFQRILERYFIPYVQNDGVIRPDSIQADILDGMQYLNKRFYQRLILLELEYRLVLRQIREYDKDQTMVLITQGYDNPLPTNRKACLFSFQGIMNRVLQSGNWLHYPMRKKGITDVAAQQHIAKAMIFLFNQMLIKLAIETSDKDSTQYKFPQHCHIDNRDLVQTLSNGKPEKLWFDELHPRYAVYHEIVMLINKIAADKSNRKRVYVTRNKKSW